MCMKITGSRALEKLYFEFKFRNLISFFRVLIVLCWASIEEDIQQSAWIRDEISNEKNLREPQSNSDSSVRTFFGSKLHSTRITCCAAMQKKNRIDMRRADDSCTGRKSTSHTRNEKRIIQKKKRKFSARSTSSPSQHSARIECKRVNLILGNNFYAQTNFSSLVFSSHQPELTGRCFRLNICDSSSSCVCVRVFNFPADHPQKISGPRRSWTTKS